MSSNAGTALVTGASRRIGRVIALALAKVGFDIAVHYRSSLDDARSLVAQIEVLGGRAEPFECDLANAEAVAGLIPRIASRLGPPACLINNASMFEHDTVQTMQLATWTCHQDVNLRAPLFLAQALTANLPEGVSGNIINIIDQRALRPTPEFFSYTISKSALWTATRVLAQALAPRVRVNAIGPGPILQSIHQTPEDFRAEQESTPLRRGASPEDIADAVLFILRTPSMTGQMITLDGGQHLG